MTDLEVIEAQLRKHRHGTYDNDFLARLIFHALEDNRREHPIPYGVRGRQAARKADCDGT